MRFIFLLALLFIFLFDEVGAQSPRGDSLRNLVENSKGTQRADALNEYGYFVLSYDYVEARKIIQQAYELSEKLNYKKGLCESFMYKGTIEDRIGMDSLSSVFFSEALIQSKKINDKHLEGRVLTAVGLANQHKNQLDSAASYYQRSYALLKDSLNPLYLSFLYLRMAELSDLRNNHAIQLPYLKRSWEIRKKLADPHPLVWAAANLANYYIQRGNYDSALFYVDYSQKKLGRDTTSEEASVIYRNKAVISANKGEHIAALNYFTKVKRFYEQNPFGWNLVDLFMEIGITQAEVSNFEVSLKYYFQALKLAEANHFDLKVAQLHFRIARVYYFLQQNAISEEFAKKSLTYSTAHHLELDEAFAENLLGSLYMRKKQFEVALSHFNRALELRQKNENRVGVAGTLGSIGEMYENANELQKAEEYSFKALAIAEEAGFALGKCYTYLSIGQLYLKKHEYQKAEDYLDRCEAFAKGIHFPNVIVKVYKSKSDLWRARADYPRALMYSDKYDLLKDSIFNTNVENRILTLQYDFELDKKDNEIRILNQQTLLQDNQIRQQRIIIVVVIIILLSVGIGAYIIFSYYKRVKQLNRAISEQNEEISAQSEELIEANETLGKLNRETIEQKEEIQAQSEELAESNRAIARINEGLEEKIKERTSALKEAYHELDTFFYRSSHDFRRPLTTFMGLSEVAKVSVKEAAALELFEKVKETADNLDKMLGKLQSVNLISSVGLTQTEISFKDIFESETHFFQDEFLKRKIIVTSEVEVNKPVYSYPALIKVVVQNLIENAISFCTDEKPVIHLSASEKSGEVRLQVKDNGQGIDAAYLPRVFEMYFRANERSTGNGLGLYIVKKMVDKMNGRIEIISKVGKGTDVKIFLPFNIL